MSEVTIIPKRAATTAAEVRADGGGVAVAARVTAAGLLARMSKGTVSPIMAPAPGAPFHLEFIHAEMVSSIRISVIVFIFMVIPVGREIFVKVSFVGKLHGGVLLDVIVREEEFPWRNFNVFEGHFSGELVRGLEVVLLSTSGAHLFSGRWLMAY